MCTQIDCGLQTHQTAALGLRAEEVDKRDIKRSGNDQNEEELPANLIQGDRPCDEQDDVCKIQARHSDTHALTSNVGWEDLGAKI